jgi:hypothetical protein
MMMAIREYDERRGYHFDTPCRVLFETPTVGECSRMEGERLMPPFIFCQMSLSK